MKLLENLELVEVTYENDNKKVVLTFLDKEAGEIRNVNFNKQAYVDGKYVNDEAKAKQVDEWCEEYFNTTFENLTSCVGVTKTVYAYDTFSSLWECAQVEKFTKEMAGEIYQTTIKEIIADDIFIKIHYEIDGKTYETKQTLGGYIESMKLWVKDPVKAKREHEKFADRYGVDISEKDTLIGRDIIVEVKCAFNKFYYGEIKKLPKRG